MRNLLSRFAALVEVSVSPDLFVFTAGERSLSLRPVVFIADGHKGIEVVGFGDSSASSPHAESVPLFSQRPTTRHTELFRELLPSFLGYGFRQVLGGSFFLRPRVIIVNMASLDLFLSGYQSLLFLDAATWAGASTVELRR